MGAFPLAEVKRGNLIASKTVLVKDGEFLF
jgi:hypothetical protein